jgi:outer membrane lipoprotein SlyB
MYKKSVFLLTVTLGFTPLCKASDLTISQHLWEQFSVADRSTLLSKFPNLELASPDTIGVIQAVQTVNRSTAGTNTGAILGGAFGQAAYVDNALKGNGSNYSAVNHIGSAVLGAAIGSSVDQSPQRSFDFNYAIKTLDGQLREVRTSSSQEFTKPIGQCVSFPDLRPLQAITCSTDKVQLLKNLSASSSEQSKAQSKNPNVNSDIKVACRINGVGLMTLERSVCREMEGKEE